MAFRQKAVGLRGEGDWTKRMRFGFIIPRKAVIGLAALIIVAAALFVVHAYRYREQFVFVTVEESSTSALKPLPASWEKLPGAFIDGIAKSIEFDKPPLLLGVSLGVHYVSSSQGIEFNESLRFSRTGRAIVSLSDPASVQGRDWSGNPVEMVNNAARVTRGDLVVEKTEASGVVHFRYGDERFSLAPGQAWSELLASFNGETRKIAQESWETEIDACLASRTPATRVAVANHGFWPKDGVKKTGYSVRSTCYAVRSSTAQKCGVGGTVR